jgi:hypothetical protein
MRHRAIQAYKTECQQRARDVHNGVVEVQDTATPTLRVAKNRAEVAILADAFGQWRASQPGSVGQAARNLGTGLGLLARAGTRLAAASLVGAAWVASAALLPSERVRARLSFTLSHHCLHGAVADVRQAFASPHQRALIAGAYEMDGAAQEGHVVGTYGPIFSGVR